MTVFVALNRFGLKQFSKIGWNGCYTLRCKNTNIEYIVSPKSNVISIVLSMIVGIAIIGVVGFSFSKTAIFDSAIFGIIFVFMCCSGMYYVRLYIICKYISSGDRVTS